MELPLIYLFNQSGRGEKKRITKVGLSHLAAWFSSQKFDKYFMC
jgi:hypothetical protein